MTEKTCFVVMGFGKKTDFETNRVLDLDKSYRNIIKPAVEAAGFKCIRADEIVHSGLIDVPMYKQLLEADIVIADLSTSNKNAFYELGIRHALRPFSTIIIAEDGIKTFPFDINHVAVRQYHHMGEDIGFDEVMRFRDMLTSTIKTIDEKAPDEKYDSPVYTFLKGLTQPALAASIQAAMQDPQVRSAPGAAAGPDLVFAAPQSTPVNTPTHSALMAQVDEAQKAGDWATAKALLATMRRMANAAAAEMKAGATVETLIEAKEDPYLLQRLVLATYKSELPDEQTAFIDARDLLLTLDPETSNDMETLGLWASVHKRLWQLDAKPEYLDHAIKAAERGFFMANSHYNGINYAFLLNLRAANTTDADEAIADIINARRVRKKVLELCDQWLKNNKMPDANETTDKGLKEYMNRWYWVMGTKGEALVGLGNEQEAEPILQEAYSKVPEPWMKTSTEEQVGELRKMVTSSK